MTKITGTRPDINIRQGPSEARVKVGRAAPIRLALASPYGIRLAVAEFIRTVESVRPIGDEPTPADFQRFVRGVRSAAYDCFCDVTLGSFDDLANVIGEVGTHLARMGNRTPSVQIVSTGAEYLPWEWLAEPIPRSLASSPPRARRASDDVGTSTQYLDEVLDILGFAAATYRILAGQPRLGDTEISDSQYLLPREEKLQVRFIRHEALSGSSRQEGYFNSRRRAVLLVGPIPDAACGLPVDLPTQLLDPAADSIEIGQRLAGDDQIVHIHCHHQSSAQPSPEEGDRNTLVSGELVLRDSPRMVVTFAQLRTGTASPTARRELGLINRPLVFLNACRGDFQPASTQSFSQLLIRNGNRGIISTSVKVPDSVAALFAGFFYDSFLFTPGMTVAQALRAAKVKLLERYKNPLGLLYTYAGNPDLLVAPTLSNVVSVSMPI